MELDKAWTKKRGQGEQNKVRVMVRVRPYSARELHGLEPNEYPISTVGMVGSTVTVEDHPYPFEFDEAFWSIPAEQKQMCSKPFADQEAVFNVTGCPSVSHALSGFHSCIFAYGQTGSGKTHTMLGSEENPGVAPRIVEELFRQLDELKTKRGQFSHQVEISFMEIYNEKVKDLFTEVSDALQRKNTRRISGARRDSSPGGPSKARRQSRGEGLTPDGTSPGMSPKPGEKRRGSKQVQWSGDDSPGSRRPSVEPESPKGSPRNSRELEPFSWVNGAGAGAASPPSSPKRVRVAMPEDDEVDKPFGKSATSFRQDRKKSFQGEAARKNSAASIGGGFGGGFGGERRQSRGWFGGAFGSPTDDTGYEALRVRFSRQQGTFVEGLTRLGLKDGVKTAEDVKRHMRFGMEHRSTAATQMNDTSSRSHAIFQICVKSTNPLAGVQRYAHINLVDLAGSERIKMSMAEGDRFVEATRINLSLSTLRRVIDLLIENSQKGKVKQVVPYRDSMLTWILSDSLGGNSKTSMIATVSPALSNREDTINTLKYANKAKDIVNTVYVNEQKTNVAMNAMQREIHELRNRINEANKDGETADVAELQDQLKCAEGDFQIAKDDLERAEIMRKEHEDLVKEKEEMIQVHTQEMEELKQLRVEEKHLEEQYAVEEEETKLGEVRQKLEAKTKERMDKEAEHMREQHRVRQILHEQEQVQSRELAFRKETLVVRRKQFALAFHKAFKETKTVNTRARLETEVRATTDRVAKGSLEIQLRAEQARELGHLCEGLKNTTARLESRAVGVEGDTGMKESECQEEIRKVRDQRHAAETRTTVLRADAKKLQSALLLEQERKTRAAHISQEKRRATQGKVDSVLNEREKKQQLLVQLKKQLGVLNGEVERLQYICKGMADTRGSMQREYEQLQEQVETLRAEKEHFTRDLNSAEGTVPRGKERLGSLAALAEERKREVEEHRRTHGDLRDFVSHRFFRPAQPGSLEEEGRSSSPVDTERAALGGIRERTWTHGGCQYLPIGASPEAAPQSASPRQGPRGDSPGRGGSPPSRSRLSTDMQMPGSQSARVQKA
eukprot:Hpha_TRINITY_DN11487_c0_g1::TRINITY_DN11487_c0_g1_i1::g.137365::m.137365/K17914/KIF13; kinesin family member 13